VNCYTTGEVIGSGAAGGIAGVLANSYDGQESYIKNCYSNATVSDQADRSIHKAHITTITAQYSEETWIITGRTFEVLNDMAVSVKIYFIRKITGTIQRLPVINANHINISTNWK